MQKKKKKFSTDMTIENTIKFEITVKYRKVHNFISAIKERT